MNAALRFPIMAAVVLAALAPTLAACGGGGGETTAVASYDRAAVSSNLEAAGYDVTTAAPGQSALPGLVDVDFATGPDSGFEGAIQVSGNGLAPFDPTDLSKTGFVLFYDDADAAAAADDSIGDGEGQQLDGNALFVYGGGIEPPSAAFDEMVSAATGA